MAMGDRKLERYARIIALYRAVRNRADGLIKPYELRVRSELLERDAPYESERLAAVLKPVKSGYVDAKWALDEYPKEALLESGAVSVAAEKLRGYEKAKAKPLETEGYARELRDSFIAAIDAHETESQPRLEINASPALKKAIERTLARFRLFSDFPAEPK